MYIVSDDDRDNLMIVNAKSKKKLKEVLSRNKFFKNLIDGFGWNEIFEHYTFTKVEVIK